MSAGSSRTPAQSYTESAGSRCSDRVQFRPALLAPLSSAKHQESVPGTTGISPSSANFQYTSLLTHPSPFAGAGVQGRGRRGRPSGGNVSPCRSSDTRCHIYGVYISIQTVRIGSVWLSMKPNFNARM